ncbi:MAG: Tim44 domain-containing protein [Rhodospirillales bacterium]|nr:Tim44 domain-containing protein [Rhodospirillales bacterium]MBO6787618.1 Tim44 domain-containing protein [Rhodospirillales bacterium]
MGGEFQFFDIIILAMIAGFLILRLRRVLGRRDGHEGGYHDRFREREQVEKEAGDDNIVHLPDRTDGPADAPSLDIDADDPVAAGLTQIRVADPSFGPDEFVEGGKMAFEMILNAFASGDRKTLKGLLSPDVYKNFDEAITERERAGEVLEDTLVGIRSAKIVEAVMDGHHSIVTVKFVSEQISALRDAEGNIIDGNPNEVIDVTDFWTFSRDTRSSDPNWTLIGTESNN